MHTHELDVKPDQQQQQQQHAYTLFKRKTYKHNPKVSTFGIAIVKKKRRQIKLGDVTIDRFYLGFQYQINKRMGKNSRKLKYYINL